MVAASVAGISRSQVGSPQLRHAGSVAAASGSEHRLTVVALPGLSYLVSSGSSGAEIKPVLSTG